MVQKRTYKKKQKTVVFDIDDTLLQFLGMLIRLHNKLHGTCLVPDDLKEYNIIMLSVSTRIKRVLIIKTNE